MYKVLAELGFKYKRVKENRKVFIERNGIRASRAHFLRTVKEFRKRGYRIVYLDETWVNKNHCLSKAWLPDMDTNNILNLVTNRNLLLPNILSGKGTRLIVLHAGCSETGFIEGCDLVFMGKDIDGDCHKEMNANVFMDLFHNTLVPALEESSLIIMDNASYHNTRCSDVITPTSASKKADMQQWLTSKGITFDVFFQQNQSSTNSLSDTNPQFDTFNEFDDIAGKLFFYL